LPWWRGRRKKVKNANRDVAKGQAPAGVQHLIRDGSVARPKPRSRARRAPTPSSPHYRRRRSGTQTSGGPLCLQCQCPPRNPPPSLNSSCWSLPRSFKTGCCWATSSSWHIRQISDNDTRRGMSKTRLTVVEADKCRATLTYGTRMAARVRRTRRLPSARSRSHTRRWLAARGRPARQWLALVQLHAAGAHACGGRPSTSKHYPLKQGCGHPSQLVLGVADS